MSKNRAIAISLLAITGAVITGMLSSRAQIRLPNFRNLADDAKRFLHI